MPYKTYQNFIFDGNLKSKLPTGENIPDILKYNSPITNQYMISMFLNHGKLNSFLNEYFNNINLYYLEKTDLMQFIKQCIIDFKIQKNSIPFIPFQKNTKLFETLKKKIPVLKSHDLKLLCELIDKMDNKTDIYYSLGLEKPETIKKQKGLKKKTKKENETVDEFIKNNFKVMIINNS